MTKQLLEASFVRISTTDIGEENAVVIGAGFLVLERHLLTCAHVVARALGVPDDSPETPQGIVHLDFSFLRGRPTRTAHVEHWQPLTGPPINPSGDIAVLQLTAAPPRDAQAARLTVAENLFGREFRAFGFPGKNLAGLSAYGVIRDPLPNGWLQVEGTKESSIAIERGFSGGPVEDKETGDILGMVVASTRDRVGFVIPANMLADASPNLQPGISIPELVKQEIRRGEMQDAQYQHLTGLLERLSNLLNNYQLKEAAWDSPNRVEARTRVLGILPLLDEDRKSDLLRFLHEAALIKKEDPYGNYAYPVIGLDSADLSRANLSHINLSGDALYSADMKESDLDHANLSYTNLRGIDLSGANLRNADLGSADLSRDLHHEPRRHTNLREANLTDAHLVDAVLTEADLSDAKLSGANLRYADLRAARGLTQEQIEQAMGDRTTYLPDYLQPPEAWSENAN